MSAPLLELRSITKTYRTNISVIHALKGISFNVHKGEVIGLLGVNGAGKTTLSSILATLHPATSGDILFKGRSIYKDIVGFRRELGFCPQKPNFEKLLSIRENLVFAGRYYLMDEAVIQARVDDLLKQFELDKYSNENPSILSGGYKQRLMIARALIHNPSIVILDEPTVALDPHIRRQIWDLIRSLKNQGVSVILTTHYLDEAEALSDRVVILDKGLVRLIETPQNLKTQYAKTSLEDVFIQLMSEQSKDSQDGEQS